MRPVVLGAHQIIGSTLDKVLRGHELGRTAYLLMTTPQMSAGHARPLGQAMRTMS
ncbi:hypothetical protein FDG2_3133 [Candidatus Protofrankia californiensis]|uniref:Uncharacterized protein n=1 Tax=Candidatus Protofrankia californiensis TaxID=1839754 RepID=A0A1C3NZ27_9ACTN|nr:hypothetical protein FDG2_3133 [Candidatus Protofrankia californiensis]